MPSSFSPSLRIELIAPGEQAGTWGTTTNTNLGTLIESAVAGLQTVSVISGNQALTIADGAADQSRSAVLRFTTTTGAPFNVYAPPVSKQYTIVNASAHAMTIFASTVAGNTTAAGTGVIVPAGASMTVRTDGVDFTQQNTHFNNLAYSGTLTGGTGVVNIGSGQFYKDGGGNIGIGTTSPSAANTGRAVHLANNVSTGSAEFRVTAGTAPVSFSFEGYESQGTIRMAGNFPVTFMTNNTERMRITSAGNVGIGASNPATQLEVLRTVADSAIEEIARITRSGGLASYANNRAAALTFADQNNFTLTAAVSGVREIPLGNFNGALTFSTSNTNASPASSVTQLTERMRINSAGNVGIGVSSPASRLDIGAGQVLSFGDANYGLAGGVVYPGISSGAGNILFANKNYSAAAVGLGFLNSGTYEPVLTVRTSGNVGMGTALPATNLHVIGTNGAIRMQDNAGVTKYVQMRSSASNSFIEHVGGPGDALVINNTVNGSLELWTSNTFRFGIGGTGLGDFRGAIGFNTGSARGNFTFRDASAASTIELHIRPDAGNSAWITYTENAVADRWAVGTVNGSDRLRFRSGGIAGTDRAAITNSGDFWFNSGFGSAAIAFGCRAWVNFNGTTSPGTIRASGNVSSVTYNSTGNYTMNFTNAMPDANYAFGSGCNNSSNDTQNFSPAVSTTTAWVASGSFRFQVKTLQGGGGQFNFDHTIITISIFR